MDGLDRLKNIHSRRDAVYAVSLLFACRELEIPILTSEIVDHFRVPESLLSSMMEQASLADVRIRLAKAEAYVDRASRLLGIPPPVSQSAIELTNRTRGPLINPVSRAAAAIMVASHSAGYDLQVRRVARALGITDVTVRNSVKKMKGLLRRR
jgi:transcription initiation factor TFIIIB Brf1 subunit/transcription initiation factor TFIIB